MSTDPQRAVIDYLMDPRTHGGEPVERVDTHSAVVFLVGRRALKLKRAVRFDYLDFSTEPLRRRACEAEVRINQRAAPTIYQGVIAVTREDDRSLALNGRGEPVDWLVEMTRFDQDNLFDRLASRGALDLQWMSALAAAIARFHAGADRRDDHGGRDGMRWVVEGNATGFKEHGAGILDPASCEELTARAHNEISRVADLLDERRREGLVRQCHGDLHLRNIVLLDGQPTLFDAVEFNDQISCIDVFYDVAFLLMDLWRRHLESHANTLLNAYLLQTEDAAGLTLLPLFLSCRAAVRAKTSATAARVQTDEARSRELRELAREYLVMAALFLDPAPVRLLAIGGFSGSGKTTLARALAPGIGRPPGAIIVRSDEIRKALRGVPALHHLGPEAYTPQVTRTVYQTMRDRAEALLRTGHSVIADAVFSSPAERDDIERVAASASMRFDGLWLDADPAVLIGRVSRREADASDADAAVVQHQTREDAGPISWRRLNASGDAADITATARRALDGGSRPRQ